MKDSVKTMTKEVIFGKKVYTKVIPDKDVLPQLYELSDVPLRTYPTKEPANKKCAKRLQGNFIKEEIKIENSK